MNRTLRNVLLTVVGLVAAWAVTSGMHLLSELVYPAPFDVSGTAQEKMQIFKDNFHKLTAAHFGLAILSHALGMLVGVFVAARFASNAIWPAVVVGVMWLAMTIANLTMLPHPQWMIYSDIIAALLAALLGFALARRGVKVPSINPHGPLENQS